MDMLRYLTQVKESGGLTCLTHYPSRALFPTCFCLHLTFSWLKQVWYRQKLEGNSPVDKQCSGQFDLIHWPAWYREKLFPIPLASSCGYSLSYVPGFKMASEVKNGHRIELSDPNYLCCHYWNPWPLNECLRLKISFFYWFWLNYGTKWYSPPPPPTDILPSIDQRCTADKKQIENSMSRYFWQSRLIKEGIIGG